MGLRNYHKGKWVSLPVSVFLLPNLLHADSAYPQGTYTEASNVSNCLCIQAGASNVSNCLCIQAGPVSSVYLEGHEARLSENLILKDILDKTNLNNALTHWMTSLMMSLMMSLMISYPHVTYY